MKPKSLRIKFVAIKRESSQYQGVLGFGEKGESSSASEER